MLNEKMIRNYCATLKGSEETFPFGEVPLVFKVMGKMYGLMPIHVADNEPQTISLKCDPSLAQILRQTYPAVQPGYHLNKQHWNTITLDRTIPDDEIKEMIDNSYALVVKGLKKADREALKKL